MYIHAPGNFFFFFNLRRT